jgi:hypothetical protein
VINLTTDFKDFFMLYDSIPVDIDRFNGMRISLNYHDTIEQSDL